MKPLELKEIMILHVNIGVLKVSVWIGVVNELAVDIHVRTTFMSSHVRGIAPSV